MDMIEALITAFTADSHCKLELSKNVNSGCLNVQNQVCISCNNRYSIPQATS